MPRLQAKSFTSPDDLRTTPTMHVATVAVGEATVGHCTFQPGWRWSTDVAPLIGARSCPFRHLGYTMSGTVHVVMDDGQELDIGPDTTFEIPPGHDKWVVGDEAWETVEWGGSGRAMEAALGDVETRMLATVLFTDIVDSTTRLREIGDASWRDLVARHDARLREELNVHRGREVKMTGDGLLAVFDSPTRAVRCAVAMTRAAHDLGIEMRAAVHTGEVESVADDVRGIAVHLAARLLALGGPGDVILSAATTDLIEGSGLAVEDLGDHDLKGAGDRRRAFRVVSG